MKIGVTNNLDFGIGLGLTVLGGFAMFKTSSIFVVGIGFVLFVLGIVMLGRSRLEISK